MTYGDAVHELYVDMSIHGVNLWFLNSCSLVPTVMVPVLFDNQSIFF